MKKIKLKKTISDVFQKKPELQETRWQPHHSFECSKKIKTRKVEVSYVLSLEEIKNNFYEPIRKLIENNGCNDDGVMIVDVNGAAVIAEILESIMGIKPKSNIVEILEKNIFESEFENCENSTTEIRESVGEIDDEEYEDEDDEENEEDEDEDEIEASSYEDEEYDYDKECEVYMDNIPDDSMNDY